MDNQRKLLDQKGQTMVEYILLLAVIISFVSFFFKSAFWQSYFGDGGRFDSIFKSKIEYSYRHALDGDAGFTPPNYRQGNHDSYYFGGSSRFYRPTDAYPSP